MSIRKSTPTVPECHPYHTPYQTIFYVAEKQTHCCMWEFPCLFHILCYNNSMKSGMNMETSTDHTET